MSIYLLLAYGIFITLPLGLAFSIAWRRRKIALKISALEKGSGQGAQERVPQEKF